VGLLTALGVTQGSTVGLIQCKGGTLDSSLTGGVGYSIPQPVTDAINFVLRALNVNQIKSQGGLQAGALRLFHGSEEPTTKLCAG
jgi:hypothetical protein